MMMIKIVDRCYYIGFHGLDDGMPRSERRLLLIERKHRQCVWLCNDAGRALTDWQLITDGCVTWRIYQSHPVSSGHQFMSRF